MRNSGAVLSREGRLPGGYTMMELLFVMAIIAVMAAIMFPHMQSWKRSLETKKAARQIVGALRHTRSLAITTNREHRVDFEPEFKRYRVMKGDLPNNSMHWSPTTTWIDVEGQSISMTATIDSIHFNPNGSSNLGSITVSDQSTQLDYRVIVTRTGRVRIS
jgi:type II secretion system protein H